MAFNEISLQWNGFKSNMLTNLKSLYHDEVYADVTLVSDGGSLKAHKVVLSACSPLFKNIFTQNPFEHPIIVLHDISLLSLRTLLGFVYNGEVNVTEEHLPQLLKAAEALKIKGLSGGGGKTPAPRRDSWEDYRNSPDSSKQFDEVIPQLPKCKDEIESYDSQECIPDLIAVDPPDIIKVETIISEEESEITVNDVVDTNIIERYNDSQVLHFQNNVKCLTKPKKRKQECLKLNQPEITKSKNRKTNVSKNSNAMNENGTEGKCCNDVESLDGNGDDFRTDIEKEIDSVVHSRVAVETLNSTVACDTSSDMVPNETSTAECYANPTFPCPFCSRVYHSWGYRRRHVKTCHGSNTLACKWCSIMLTSQAAWFKHAVLVHGVARAEARDSLVVMVEAHAVLASLPTSPGALLSHLQLEMEADTNS